MRIKAGDLTPPLVVDLTDTDETTNPPTTTPVDLTPATAVHVKATQGGVVLFDDAAPARDNAAGVVTHQWAAGETDIPGRMFVEVRVTWPGGKPQTFPDKGELTVDIE